MVWRIVSIVIIVVLVNWFSAGGADCNTYKNGTRRQAITPDLVATGTSGQDHSACSLSYPVPPTFLAAGLLTSEEDMRVCDTNYLDEPNEEPAEGSEILTRAGRIIYLTVFAFVAVCAFVGMTVQGKRGAGGD